ncbi:MULTISPECIES: hypothetical protein [Klebsiella pneumoniae complex]|uniref:hypothetical protein n=1 Tax=Klebsiella pneumoniae complex TaxID=3390273 RepID=UPI000B41B484|nr:hypothetical protein [Klebsiella pneumoniae]OVV58133.1 hypothetical protein BME67_24810 [Klebsiella pneumoniae]OVV61714.1 hypothetical protein BME68_11860 [Klebsiella pneumoniae]OVV69443.1 hypothetical protein BME66_10395 [Klebsiella pneumoniae]OVV73700.1 hypothetical protein BME64_27340 [Klebsiella pneumoniae]PLE97101.1 hypothetical protein B6I85_15300 [Klebsiella pneumoniae]
MARVHSIRKSGKHLDINYVCHKKSSIDQSINLFYSTKNPDYNADFVGMSIDEIEEIKEDMLKENDITHSLLLLTTIEALIRLDADKKYCDKKKNTFSRLIKCIYDRTKGERIRLEEDLINTRMNEDDVSLRGKYIDLKKCFKYRHWLAHGRYWDPKRITEVDFDSIRVLISSILVSTSIEFEID